MPAAVNPNLRRPVIPPAMGTAIRYSRDKRQELEHLNGEATEVTRGHIAGINAALSYVLEAVADEATKPHTARAIVLASSARWSYTIWLCPAHRASPITDRDLAGADAGKRAVEERYHA